MPLRKVERQEYDHGIVKSEYEFAYPGSSAVNEIWYEEGRHFYSPEEIAVDDEKFLKSNEEGVRLALEDGFIRYPIFAYDRAGELVELSAWLHPDFEPSCSEGFFERHKMHTNIYIPSYGRADFAPTPRVLDSYGVKNYYMCVDPSQYEAYRKHFPLRQIVLRDILFRREDMVEPISSFRRPMSMAGHAPLCNFTLALSRSLGEECFTFSDDDFVGFAMKARKGDEKMDAKEVYDKNNFYRCSSLKPKYGFDFQSFWSRMEKLASNARNPGFVGLEKFGTVFALPMYFRTGTRVYSFYVTKNDTQITHIGYQNNDVITSLELSKHGLINLLFEGICYNSMPTQKGKGGQVNMYKRFGTLDKGLILVRAHPGDATVSDKYSRIHHALNLNQYRNQRIVGRPIDPDERVKE